MWLQTLLFWGLLTSGVGQSPLLKQETPPNTQNANSGMRVIRKDRTFFPLRLGGIFLYGLGDSPDPLENSAQKSTPLSASNAKFITEMCDVIALPANTLTPQTFPKLMKPNALFTPLLIFSSSTLYEQNRATNVGGWRPEMTEWTLKDAEGKEIPHPETGGHWMDFGNPQWADHWKNRVQQQIAQYGAYGVVALETPLGNTSLPEKLAKYPTRDERAEAFLQWLRQVRGQYMMVPSALGFDETVHHSTLPVEEKFREVELAGRFWDYYLPYVDGVWGEGWLQPYWADYSLPIGIREIHLAAANRSAKNGHVFIANPGYRNAEDLETLAAHFLLVNYTQSSMVFQPMPIVAGQPSDAGYSLALYRKQIEQYPGIFLTPLGVPQEEKIRVRCLNGYAWRRRFQFGVVYVNPADRYSVKLPLGSQMLCVDGRTAYNLELAPRSGVILLYPPTLKSLPEVNRKIMIKEAQLGKLMGLLALRTALSLRKGQ